MVMQCKFIFVVLFAIQSIGVDTFAHRHHTGDVSFCSLLIPNIPTTFHPSDMTE